MEQYEAEQSDPIATSVAKIAGLFDYLLSEEAGFQIVSGDLDARYLIEVQVHENIPENPKQWGEYRLSRARFEAQLLMNGSNYRHPVQEAHTLVSDEMVAYRESPPIDTKTARIDRHALYQWDEMRRQRLLLAAGRIIDSLFRAE